MQASLCSILPAQFTGNYRTSTADTSGMTGSTSTTSKRSAKYASGLAVMSVLSLSLVRAALSFSSLAHTLSQAPGMWKLTGINALKDRYRIVKRDSNELFDRVTVMLDWDRVKKMIKYGGKVY